MARPKRSAFQGDVTHNGKRYRAAGFTTLEAAQIWELETKAALLRGLSLPPGPASDATPTLTLGEALDYTYREHWAALPAAQTFRDRIASVKRMLGPNYPAADLATPNGFAALRAACEARGNGGNTTNVKASLVSKAIKFCIQKGLLQGIAPPMYEHLPKLPGRDRIVSREEEQAMHGWLSQVDPAMADWFLLCIDTGARSYSEALNVYPHIDVRGPNLHIRGRLIVEAGPNVVEIEVASALRRTKTGRSRVVGLTGRVQAMIGRRLPGLGRNSKLFPATLTPRVIQDRWGRMKLALGLADDTLVPYALRHTFGTRMVLAGETLPNLQSLMGHSTINQTMKYVHLAGLVQTGAVGRLEKFLDGSA